MVVNNETKWCDVINLDNTAPEVKERIKEQIIKSFEEGYSSLEIKAALISCVEVLLYEAELDLTL